MDAGWYSFFERIRGFNVEVSLEFARNFAGTQVNFVSMSFEFSEALIAEVTRLSIEGDQWFRKFPFEVDLNLFLLPGHESLDWSKGVHQNSLKE